MHSDPEANHVLLVEDEAIVALNERKTLEEHGFSVTTVQSGEAAVQACEEDEGIELVLMDIDLGPGIDGIEAARRILAMRELPIVFLTAHAEKEYLDRVKAVTRYGYVLKNAGTLVLVEAVNMALALFEAHQETKERKECYRALVENAPVSIALVDERLRFVSANPRSAEALGFEGETLSGKSLWEVFPADAAAFRAQRVGEVLRDNESRSFEVEHGGRVFHSTLIPYNVNHRRAVHVVTQQVSGFREPEAAPEKTPEDRQVFYAELPLPYHSLDAEGRILNVNPAWTKTFGYSKEEVIGVPYAAFLDPDSGRSFRRNFARFKEQGEVHGAEHKLRRKDGQYREVSVEGTVARASDGSFRETCCLLEDVTESKETEERLRKAAKAYRDLFDSIRDAILVADTNRTIVDCNEAFTELFGYSLAEIEGRKTQYVYADEAEFKRMGEAIAEHGEDPQFFWTVAYRKKSGEVFKGETNVFYRRDAAGRKVAFIGLIRDVTDRLRTEQQAKEQQREIERLLEEKDLLLREVHHRIKNDMGSIEGLLGLQAQTSQSTEVADSLEEARTRVALMRRIYDTLYRREDFRELQARSLVQYLVDEVQKAYGVGARVEIHTEIEEITLPSRLAFPVGIIVNELVTNALKYAFPGDREGQIMVSLIGEHEKGLRVTVSDNGIGLPEEQVHERSYGFGLNVVDGLVRQQGGSLHLTRDQGTKAEAVFRW